VPSSDFNRYDPQTGRFLTQDPIGLAGGVNLYAYAGNNPVSYSDPYGLNPCLIAPQACMAVAGGIIYGGIQLASNVMHNRPALEDVGSQVASGAAAGLSLGASTLLSVAARTVASGGESVVAGSASTTLNYAERGLLREFFGQGLKGAEQRAADFSLPQGLTGETLQKYAQVAQRAIARGLDKTGVQAERLKLIERALETLKE
jgi:uncharacterized protein RhaS with RHS repeats